MFSIIGPVDGMRVLDLYAGTGALGIEALSRGAAHVTFVERDTRMRAVLLTNLGVTAGDAVSREAAVRGGDAVAYLRRVAGAEQFDLVLLDPPYADAERLNTPLAEALPPVLAETAKVVVECDRRTPLALETGAHESSPASLTLVAERRYGDTLLRILRTSAGD